LLLRSYTGLFSQYVSFDEYTLAKRAGMQQQEVYNYLVKLAGMKVINYIPKKGNPVITLLEERLDQSNVRISAELYKFRKERFIERTNELLEYASSETKCRSRYLLSYFGEKNAGRCGQCDVCIGKKNSKLSVSEHTDVADEIVQLLEAGPIDLSGLVMQLDKDPEAVAAVLDNLTEEGRIKRRDDLSFEICT
ncbi:MAG: RecQ family zinc-binding domain-containing protein, partial [Bacteroidales bacterium]|nr:RecQ family zinc-binding domain-containing protein [Bacteroidales bacterium]